MKSKPIKELKNRSNKNGSNNKSRNRELKGYRGRSIQSEDLFPDVFYEKEQHKRGYQTYLRYKSREDPSKKEKLKQPYDI